MTEKRFVLEEFGLNFIVNDNGRQLSARQTVDLLNELHEQLEPIQKICKKYNIKIEDLPGTLEEYIANDNDGYAGYSKCDGCKHTYEVVE